MTTLGDTSPIFLADAAFGVSESHSARPERPSPREGGRSPGRGAIPGDTGAVSGGGSPRPRQRRIRRGWIGIRSGTVAASAAGGAFSAPASVRTQLDLAIRVLWVRWAFRADILVLAGGRIAGARPL